MVETSTPLFVLAGLVLHLGIGIFIAYVMSAMAPGGVENNWQPSSWSREDRWFMILTVFTWPYWLLMLIIYAVRERRRNKAD